MAVFGDFAMETKDVMEEFSITRQEALKLLNELERHGLVCGEFHDGNGTMGMNRRAVPGINKMWQCYVTYDSENTEKALERVTKTLNGEKVDSPF